MALTGTDRGTGGTATASTSCVVTPASNLAAGSMGVLVLGVENGVTGGATASAPAIGVDSVGNTWTRQLNIFADPGSSGQGTELSIYTAPLTTALTTADNLTLTLLISERQAWALVEVTAAGSISFVAAGGANLTAPTATPTVTTSSIPNADMVIGGGASEGADTWVDDADTSNGSWSAGQSIGFGSGTSGQSVQEQRKVVTATATQTFNPTLTSADCVVGWIQLNEGAAAADAVPYRNRYAQLLAH